MLYIPQIIPVGSTIVFCFILVILQQSVNGQTSGQNWKGDDIKWRLNYDFPGHDIERIKSTGDICGPLCIASNNCTHFRYASDGYCYLENAPLEIQETFATEGMCGFIEPGKMTSFYQLHYVVIIQR